MILVGPGTGLAPMRAIIQERTLLSNPNNPNNLNKNIHTVLFYGCRKYNDDCLYKNEWLNYINDIPIPVGTSVVNDTGMNRRNENIFVSIAYSQENVQQLDYAPTQFTSEQSSSTSSTIDSNSNNNGESSTSWPVLVGKVYVTYKIKLYHELIWELMQQGAVIFVAGSAKRMPLDVRNAFISVIQRHYIPPEHTEMDSISINTVNIDVVESKDNNIKCSNDEATTYFNTHFIKTNKYIVEAWS